MKPIIVLASICFFVVASADTLNEPFDRVYYMKQVKNSNYVLTIDCPDTGKHTIPINKKKFDNSYYSQHAMALLEGMGPCVCNSPVLILRMVTGRVLTKCLKETCTKDTQFVADYLLTFKNARDKAYNAYTNLSKDFSKDYIMNLDKADEFSVLGVCKGHFMLNMYALGWYSTSYYKPSIIENPELGFGDEVGTGTTPKSTSKPTTKKPATERPTTKRPNILNNVKPEELIVDLTAVASHINVAGSHMHLSLVPQNYPYCIQRTTGLWTDGW